MEQPNEILMVTVFFLCGAAFNSLFGLAASKIFESKGRSKSVGFWIGFFGGIFGILIAALLPMETNSSTSSSSVMQRNLATYGYSRANQDHVTSRDDELAEAEWREKLKKQDREYEEQYQERKRVERERDDAYWEAKERREREEQEYWEDKRRAENDD